MFKKILCILLSIILLIGLFFTFKVKAAEGSTPLEAWYNSLDSERIIFNTSYGSNSNIYIYNDNSDGSYLSSFFASSSIDSSDLLFFRSGQFIYVAKLVDGAYQLTSQSDLVGFRAFWTSISGISFYDDKYHVSGSSSDYRIEYNSKCYYYQPNSSSSWKSNINYFPFSETSSMSSPQTALIYINNNLGNIVKNEEYVTASDYGYITFDNNNISYLTIGNTLRIDDCLWRLGYNSLTNTGIDLSDYECSVDISVITDTVAWKQKNVLTSKLERHNGYTYSFDLGNYSMNNGFIDIHLVDFYSSLNSNNILKWKNSNQYTGVSSQQPYSLLADISEHADGFNSVLDSDIKYFIASNPRFNFTLKVKVDNVIYTCGTSYLQFTMDCAPNGNIEHVLSTDGFANVPIDNNGDISYVGRGQGSNVDNASDNALNNYTKKENELNMSLNPVGFLDGVKSTFVELSLFFSFIPSQVWAICLFTLSMMSIIAVAKFLLL